MSEEFKPITTQEEFDAAIKSRLARERETVQKQFSDYEDLKKQVEDLKKEKATYTQDAQNSAGKLKDLQDKLDAANVKIKGYELDALKTAVAIEKGLPLELRSRLTGNTEEEIKADAASLAELFKAQNRQGLPGFQKSGNQDDYETTGKVNEDRAMKKFAESLKLINE